MKSKIILWAVLAILGAQLITPVSASPSTWLYYDDNECDSHGTLWTEDDVIMIAVLFTDIGYCKLLRVKYYIADEHNYAFKLHIMGSDWEDIYTETCTPSQIGWFEVDLTEEGIVVSGQFYVGMECYNNINLDGMFLYVPEIGRDWDDPDVGHSWLWWGYPDSTDIQLIEGSDFMIRAEIEPFVPPVEYEKTPTDDTFAYEPVPTGNYGDRWDVITGWYIQQSWGYLMFNLSHVPCNDIESVILRLYVYRATLPPLTIRVNLYSTSDAWDEDTLTWNNKPGRGDLLAFCQVDGNRTYANFTSPALTSYVKQECNADQKASFVLSYHEDLGVGWHERAFASKEHPTDPPPILVIRRFTAVGGFRVPVDKLALLTPYIGLASTILVATIATAIYVKHVKRRKEKQ